MWVIFVSSKHCLRLSLMCVHAAGGSIQWSLLTHWGRGKMAAIFQTTFSNAFSWVKMFEFCLRFHWSLLQRFELITSLVQILAWRWPGDKPSSEAMMVRLPMHIYVTQPQWVNSLSPHSSGFDFKKCNFQSWFTECMVSSDLLMIMASTLVLVMAWYCQAISHYLSQCWPRHMPSFGITRPQWVNIFRHGQNGHQFTEDTSPSRSLPLLFSLPQLTHLTHPPQFTHPPQLTHPPTHRLQLTSPPSTHLNSPHAPTSTHNTHPPKLTHPPTHTHPLTQFKLSPMLYFCHYCAVFITVLYWAVIH